MKPYLTYGSFIAIGNAVITLVLYLAGFHSDPAKLQTGNYIALVAGLGLSISLLVFGIRAKRATVPTSQDFNYGLALGAGVMISLYAALFGTVFQYIYQSFINPGFADTIVQAQIAQLQARGLSSDQIDKAEPMMRMFTKPAVQAVIGFISGIVGGSIISLVAAAFLKRTAVAQPPTPPATQSS